MSTKYARYADSVSEIERGKGLRKIQPMVPINGAFLILEDEKMLSFCSHDYLGLADNPDIKKNAIKYILEHGITASSESRDLFLRCQLELEKKLSDLLCKETALFFPSRFEANQVALSTLGHSDATFFIDRNAHPSIREGVKNCDSQVMHFQMESLEKLLKNCKTKTKIIVTESVSSYSGHVANLPKLGELAEVYDALLFVDDSHALGVAGVEGMGLGVHLKEIDILTGSFSKACGAYGGYVACSQTIRDYLVNLNPIQTTFLFPPPIIGAMEKALELIPQMEGERKQLQQRSHWLRNALRGLGFDAPMVNTPLISLLFENSEELEQLRIHLKKKKIFVGPTRPYEKAEESPRLNLALNICHMPDHCNRLVEAIEVFMPN